jgi:hypothetical protein
MGEWARQRRDYVLAEAMAQVDKTGARLHEAELYRLKGEILLAQEVKSQKSKI